MNAIKNQQQGFKPAGTTKNLISLFKSLFSGGLLLKIILLFIVFALAWQVAEAQFQTLWYLKVPMGQIQSVSFSHNSKWLMVIGSGGGQIYDTEKGMVVKDSIPWMNYPIFSLDDTHLFTVNGKKLVNLNLNTNKNEAVADTSDKDIEAISMSNNQKYLLGTTVDGFRVWDIQTGKIIKTKFIPIDSTKSNDPTQYHLDKQLNLEILPSCDNSKIFLRTYYEYVKKDNKGNDIRYGKCINRIFDFNTLDSIGIIPNASWTFWLSYDCQYIAMNNTDSNNTQIIQIYDLNSWNLISTIKLPGIIGFLGVKFISENTYLVTGTSAGADVWEVSSGKFIKKVEGGTLYSLDISDDSKYGATSIEDDLYVFSMAGINNVQSSKSNIETIYPNPTTGNVIIQFNQLVPEITNINLTDITGNFIKTILNGFLDIGRQRINFTTSDLTAGSYFVKVQNSHLSLVFKLIVSK